jgi:hypothetical protein
MALLSTYKELCVPWVQDVEFIWTKCTTAFEAAQRHFCRRVKMSETKEIN